MGRYIDWTNRKAREKYWVARDKIPKDELLEAIKRFARQERERGTEREYIPYPATWLHNERFFDEPLNSAGTQISKDGWPEWKKRLARAIGEKDAGTWFTDADMHGDIIYVQREFQVQQITQRFMTGLNRAFGDGVQVQLMKAEVTC